jgi:isoquinoline 1-oxidoreductase beta subunit
VVALEHKIICQDIRNQGPNDTKASRGIAGGVNTDYSIPNFSVRGVLRKLHIPISYWRSVYHSTNCFAHESFIDELANAAKQDPLGLRLAMLTDHRRFTNVLKEVAAMSDWYQAREKDTGKGVAIVERSGAFIAMVAEVKLVDKKVNVHKIYTAVDCGITVNPDTVVAQTEGSIVMALTATFKSAHTVKNGAIVEKNFHTYKMLQLNECPEIVVSVLRSADPPEGAGESGLPTLAPALTNAIFEMTGKRIRTLPFDLNTI